ncbi:hypothetical protein PVT71_29160 (plasmid) [Salipiger sp. H15]|uniref:Leucyl aminopeptidase n=1 Tax=Alloyangia sp. H15 TaxID=3029062 RepID=A0AAU8ASA1_9RHOB
MTAKVSDKHMRVARRIIQDMFAVKPGEVVALTADDGTDPEITRGFYEAAVEVDAKPLVLQFRKARNNGEAGMADWPAAAMEAALKHADVWIENNEAFTLYSSMWERVLEANERIRYNVLAGSSIDSLERVFCDFDISRMARIIEKIVALAKQAGRVRAKGASGTDVTFDLDPTHVIDFDSGDFSKKKFGTAPGYVNLVPKTGTMEGRIVFDMIMHADLSQGGTVEFEMRNGRITGYGGSHGHLLRDYVEGFDEENMRKISHMMIGLCAGVRDLSWEIVEDERIWGGIDFGFGHTSPLDMPPHGQIASSHFDGISTRATIWFDDVLILENGVFVHPDIKDDAEALLAEYEAERKA